MKIYSLLIAHDKVDFWLDQACLQHNYYVIHVTSVDTMSFEHNLLYLEIRNQSWQMLGTMCHSNVSPVCHHGWKCLLIMHLNNQWCEWWWNLFPARASHLHIKNVKYNVLLKKYGISHIFHMHNVLWHTIYNLRLNISNHWGILIYCKLKLLDWQQHENPDSS